MLCCVVLCCVVVLCCIVLCCVLLLCLSEYLDCHIDSWSDDSNQSCSHYVHRFIFDFLSPLGLTPMTCSTLLSQCGKAIAWLTAESRSFRTGINIEKFMDAVTVVTST